MDCQAAHQLPFCEHLPSDHMRNTMCDFLSFEFCTRRITTAKRGMTAELPPVFAAARLSAGQCVWAVVGVRLVV